jgi:hypothetical protein
MRNPLMGSIIAFVCLLVFSSIALGQGAPAGASKPFDPHNLSTNFTGVWSSTNLGDQLTPGVEPPMKPAALAKYKMEKTVYSNPPVDGAENTDPLFRCEPGSAPRHYFNGHPYEFIHTPAATVMLIETYRNFRIFYTDGRKHPDHPEGTWYGDSIARWDGNTMVVDTINFNDRTWIDKLGHPHSDKMRLIERITRTAFDKMEIDITIDDPVSYERPWGGKKLFTLRPGWMIEDYLCSPKDEGFMTEKVRDPADTKK